MSSPDINYPTQPTYGEGLAEALKAQAEFLQGTGDFADVGSLESLLPLKKVFAKRPHKQIPMFFVKLCSVRSGK